MTKRVRLEGKLGDDFPDGDNRFEGLHKYLVLPPPRVSGGKPLLDALGARHSTRAFSSRSLEPQMLSDLLWAAFGINRREKGGRTAPSWHQAMEIDLYVVQANGVWRYEPKKHELSLQCAGDFRAQTGAQEFAGVAALDLIYVADRTRMPDLSPEEQRLYGYADTGFIGQNVYLFCASEGLVTVFRGSVDRDNLAKTIKLDAKQLITFAQTVGYPPE